MRAISATGSKRWAPPHVYRARQSLGEWFCESFNGELRDECLNGEIFYSLREAQVASSDGALSTTRAGRTPPSVIVRPPRRPVGCLNPRLRPCLMPHENSHSS